MQDVLFEKVFPHQTFVFGKNQSSLEEKKNHKVSNNIAAKSFDSLTLTPKYHKVNNNIALKSCDCVGR
jgi:hypothetical protein